MGGSVPEHEQDAHVVLADALIGAAGLRDLRDEGGPILRPVVLQNLQ